MQKGSFLSMHLFAGIVCIPPKDDNASKGNQGFSALPPTKLYLLFVCIAFRYLFAVHSVVSDCKFAFRYIAIKYNV